MGQGRLRFLASGNAESVAPTNASNATWVARTGHIPLGQFPLTCSDVRCGQIDGAAGLFAGSGLTGLHRRLLLSRKVRKSGSPDLPVPPRRSARGGVELNAPSGGQELALADTRTQPGHPSPQDRSSVQLRTTTAVAGPGRLRTARRSSTPRTFFRTHRRCSCARSKWSRTSAPIASCQNLVKRVSILFCDWHARIRRGATIGFSGAAEPRPPGVGSDGGKHPSGAGPRTHAGTQAADHLEVVPPVALGRLGRD